MSSKAAVEASLRPEHGQYTQADSEGAREDGFKLKEEIIRLDVRK